MGQRRRIQNSYIIDTHHRPAVQESWYKVEPHNAPLGSDSYLSRGNYRHIDFATIFRQEPSIVLPKSVDHIALGEFGTILQKAMQCGFCRLVARLVSLDCVSHLPLTTIPEERTRERTAKLRKLPRKEYCICPSSSSN